jgi:hypothetical protein
MAGDPVRRAVRACHPGLGGNRLGRDHHADHVRCAAALSGRRSCLTGLTHFRSDRDPALHPDRRCPGPHRAQPQVSRCGRGADLLDQGRFRLGHGSGLRHVCGHLGLRCGRGRRRGPDDHRPPGGKRLSAALCLCAGRGRCLYRHPDPALDRLYHHRPGARHLRSTLFLAALIPGICILVSILITNIVVNRIYSTKAANR